MSRLVLFLTTLVALCCAAPSPALAQAELPGAAVACHAATEQSVTIKDALAEDFAWTCDDSGWQKRRDVTWLRIEPGATLAEAEEPMLALRLARFERVSAFAVSEGVAVSEVAALETQVRPALFGPFASVALPASFREADEIIVRIDRPDLSSVGSELRVVGRESDVGLLPVAALLLAALAGVVLMPLLFDISLFAVLHHRFMLSHAGMAVGMLMAIGATNGLFVALLSPGMPTLLSLAEMGFVIILASAGFFFRDFVERACQPDWIRTAILVAIVFLLATSGVIALDLPGLGWIDQNLYVYGFVPIQLVLVTAIALALARGSRLAWFILIGWIPAVAAGMDMTANALGLQATRQLGITAPFYAMAFEVCATAIGVVYRIVELRRERDSALHDARVAEEVALRDPLTQLLNRRAIRTQFDQLARSGFSALALYDLDDFKRINDDFGHDAGDAVLKAMAKALAPSPDCVAVRMGGEEFLLLLRGPNALERADTRRTDLTETVRRTVPQVDRPVTSSMGIVLFEESGSRQLRNFSQLYAQADRLLYAAKAAGKDTYQFEVVGEADGAGAGLPA